MSRPYAPLFRSITTSERLADLANDSHRLFFSWLLTVADDWGRVTARPRQLNALVWPMLGKKPEDAEKALEDLRRVGLVTIHDSEDGPFVQIPDHEDKAGSVGKKDHRRASHWPETALLASLGPDWPEVARSGSSWPSHTGADAPPSARGASSSSGSESGSGSGSGRESAEREPKPKTKAPRKEPTGPDADVRRAFAAAFLKARGVPYAFEGGKDGEAVKILLQRAGGDPAVVIARIPALFADSWYGPKATLTKFVSAWNSIAPKAQPVQPQPSQAEIEAAHKQALEADAWARRFKKGPYAMPDEKVDPARSQDGLRANGGGG